MFAGTKLKSYLFSGINSFGDEIPSSLLFYGQHFGYLSGIAEKKKTNSFRAGEQPGVSISHWATCAFFALLLRGLGWTFFGNLASVFSILGLSGFYLEIILEIFFIVVIVVKRLCLSVCLFVCSLVSLVDTLDWLPRGIRLFHGTAWDFSQSQIHVELGHFHRNGTRFGLILSRTRLCLSHWLPLLTACCSTRIMLFWPMIWLPQNLCCLNHWPDSF